MGERLKAQERFFATCPRGLEPILNDELAALGGAEISAVDGGVHFAFAWLAFKPASEIYGAGSAAVAK